MATKYHQISFKETFSECQEQFIEDAPSFFALLSEYCDINEFIPIAFSNAFYQSLGRNRITTIPLVPLKYPFVLLFFIVITFIPANTSIKFATLNEYESL